MALVRPDCVSTPPSFDGVLALEPGDAVGLAGALQKIVVIVASILATPQLPPSKNQDETEVIRLALQG
jgi:hypothetical protein